MNRGQQVEQANATYSQALYVNYNSPSKFRNRASLTNVMECNVPDFYAVETLARRLWWRMALVLHVAARKVSTAMGLNIEQQLVSVLTRRHRI